MHDDSVNCEALQRGIRERRELKANEVVHLDHCDACMDAWLTVALDEKPEVAIPADFAARIAAVAPARQEKPVRAQRPRHLGLITAVAIVTVLLVVCFAGSHPANSWIGLTFMLVVVSEIAGLALWLGPRWSGR
jgi:hypothetical protein